MEYLMVNGVLLSDKGLSPKEVEDMFLDWLDANNLSFLGITEEAEEAEEVDD